MIVKRISNLTGKLHEMDLPITAERIAAWQNGGALIQRVFPDLSAEQREFLMTGITPEEWEATFPPEDEEG